MAVGQLPSVSSEFGKEKELQEIISYIFGESNGKTNDNGGISIHLPELSVETLSDALLQVDKTPDLMYSVLPDLSSDAGCLSYIHKVKEGRNIYFIANSSRSSIDTEISLRGKMKVELWNPYTGQIQKIDRVEYKDIDNQQYSCFRIKLDGIDSVVIIGEGL